MRFWIDEALIVSMLLWFSVGNVALVLWIKDHLKK